MKYQNLTITWKRLWKTCDMLVCDTCENFEDTVPLPCFYLTAQIFSSCSGKYSVTTLYLWVHRFPNTSFFSFSNLLFSYNFSQKNYHLSEKFVKNSSEFLKLKQESETGNGLKTTAQMLWERWTRQSLRLFYHTPGAVSAAWALMNKGPHIVWHTEA